MSWDLDTVNVPEDAGEYADGLRKILERIPPNWGRWVSCSKGWYPLLIALDEELNAIFPDYQVHQVKEKFAGLRYYIGFPDLEPECCIPIQESRPCEGAVDPRGYNVPSDRSLSDQYKLTKWFYTELSPHIDSEEHEAGMRALDPERERRAELSEKMYAIISKYENESVTICELCGLDGKTLVRGYWYRTLCPSCADREGYEEIPSEEED